MAKSINQVILMGRLTRDPETRSTSSGKQITTFSIAVDRYGASEETDFFDVTTWDKLAEIVEKFLEKGSKVLVQGRLQLDSWEDKETSQKRSRVTVTANDVTFLDSVSGDDSKKNSNLTQHEVLQKARDIEPDHDDINNKPIDLSEIPF